MTEANKFLCDFMYDFVNENWDKIDKKSMEIKDTKEEFLSKVKTDVFHAEWVLHYVCRLGMDKKYLTDALVQHTPCLVYKINGKYLKNIGDGSCWDFEFTEPKERITIYF